MNFVVLTDYYYPIVKSGSIIVGDLATELLHQGNSITVVTFVDKLDNKYQDTTEDGIRVIRVRSRSRKYGMIGRLWAEYNYSSKIIQTFNSIESISCDSIICYSPSIFYGKAIEWLKNKYDAKAYLIIRDIFPKWAVDAGIIKKGLLYKFFKYIESNLYNAADFIGIEASSDISYFNQYAKAEKIEVLDNWSAPIESVDMSLGANVLDEIKVNILYGGNMGDAQDLVSLIELIDDSVLDGKAVLTLIGEGGQVELIKKTIADKNINNIKVLPAVDRDTYLSILKRADVGLVSLNKQLASNNYPLKMVGYIQFSIPLLASVNKGNEIVDLINEKNIGLVSLAGNKKEFNKNLKLIINDEKLRKTQGQNSSDLFNDRFTVSAAVSQISGHFIK